VKKGGSREKEERKVAKSVGFHTIIASARVKERVIVRELCNSHYICSDICSPSRVREDKEKKVLGRGKPLFIADQHKLHEGPPQMMKSKSRERKVRLGGEEKKSKGTKTGKEKRVSVKEKKVKGGERKKEKEGNDRCLPRDENCAT